MGRMHERGLAAYGGSADVVMDEVSKVSNKSLGMAGPFLVHLKVWGTGAPEDAKTVPSGDDVAASVKAHVSGFTPWMARRRRESTMRERRGGAHGSGRGSVGRGCGGPCC